MLHNFMCCIVNQPGREEKADSSPEELCRSLEQHRPDPACNERESSAGRQNPSLAAGKAQPGCCRAPGTHTAWLCWGEQGNQNLRVLLARNAAQKGIQLCYIKKPQPALAVSYSKIQRTDSQIKEILTHLCSSFMPQVKHTGKSSLADSFS